MIKKNITYSATVLSIRGLVCERRLGKILVIAMLAVNGHSLLVLSKSNHPALAKATPAVFYKLLAKSLKARKGLDKGVEILCNIKLFTYENIFLIKKYSFT